MKILKKSFYEKSTVQVAQHLLGTILVRVWKGHILSGIIIETEAYCGLIDPASHAYKGETLRNKTLFGPVGHSYVYFSYGNHYCLNVVAREKESVAGGVLIRSLIPLTSIPEMQRVRHTALLSNLTNGPGKIGQALHLSLSDNHLDLTKKGALFITEGIPIQAQDISTTPRIGISKGRENLWRFILNKNAHDLIKKSL